MNGVLPLLDPEEWVYYAHSLRDYGSERARAGRRFIERLWPAARVLDPEDLDWSAVVREHGSHERAYEHVVGRARVVAVLEYQAHVGRGVFMEVSLALRDQKPAVVLRGSGVHEVRGVEVVDTRDWKVRYGRLLAGARICALPGLDPVAVGALP